MRNRFAVVDLFAGPGGLAEGFSAVRTRDGARPFKISLSVEREKSAYSTLLLRTFLRQFPSGFPEEYYGFLNRQTEEPDWSLRFPKEWEAAQHEALRLELGSAAAEREIAPRLDALRTQYSGDTILIGGPPCQAYSLMGRSRNNGIAGYVAEDDPKHFLYKEYIRILRRLKPVAFVMENVKGLLSASVGGARVLEQILEDVKSVRHDGGYRLIALAPRRGEHSFFDTVPSPADFVVRSEEFGIPQARHRIIIVGIRRDVLDIAGTELSHLLPFAAQPVGAVVEDVLDGMPKLRSGVSQAVDTPTSWAQAIQGAARLVLGAKVDMTRSDERRFRERVRQCASSADRAAMWPRAAAKPNGIGVGCGKGLKSWILDPKLKVLPNNQGRGHMAADLARYLFASVYAEVLGVSPKARDYPSALAPQHHNWRSGAFADRFRVQLRGKPSTTVTSHISKDGHYFIHPDPEQCRSLTVREAARLQTFPDNYFFKGNRTEQFTQVGNAVSPYLAMQIGTALFSVLDRYSRRRSPSAPSGSAAGRRVAVPEWA